MGSFTRHFVASSSFYILAYSEKQSYARSLNDFFLIEVVKSSKNDWSSKKRKNDSLDNVIIIG